MAQATQLPPAVEDVPPPTSITSSLSHAIGVQPLFSVPPPAPQDPFKGLSLCGLALQAASSALTVSLAGEALTDKEVPMWTLV